MQGMKFDSKACQSVPDNDADELAAYRKIGTPQQLELLKYLLKIERRKVKNLVGKNARLKAGLRARPPMGTEQFEKICETVHNGWWEEKKKQGATNHPDMIPYQELAESVKEYDRVTVRRVLDAMGIRYQCQPKEGTAV